MDKKLPPGVVLGMANDEYHAHPALGSSGLKRFSITPAHYWASYLDPEREAVDKKHFRIGRAWHCAVFEPTEFEKRYTTEHDAHPATNKAKLLKSVLAGEVALESLVALPEGLAPTSKEGKALAAELQASGSTPCAPEDFDFVSKWHPLHAGRDVLDDKSMRSVLRMADRARDLPISRVVFDEYARHGLAEASLFYRDHVSGVELKIRPDYMLTPCKLFPNGLIIDGKTTTDASEEGFGRSVWNLGYGWQAALYPMVYQGIFKTDEPPAFLWLAQEKESPYAARYYAAAQDLREHYLSKVTDLLPSFAECQRLDRWAPYPPTVKTLSVPGWAQKQIDEAAA